MSKLTLIATAVAGLESEVSYEVRALGYEPRIEEGGRILFEGDDLALARANLWLRCAERVQLVVGTFDAPTFDDLYEGVRALPWADLVPADASFPVDGNSVRSRITSEPAIQRVSKKAVVDALMEGHRCRSLPETGPEHRIRVALLKDRVVVTMDSSGMGLHKRGYRVETVEAPVKETMAAGLLRLSRWKGDRPLADPFCGSGTIAIEAALMATDRAPGRGRRFAAEDWPAVPARVWREARAEADDRVRPMPADLILASDVDPDAVAAASANARAAGVLPHVRITRADAARFAPALDYGVVVTNPPYGERLSDPESVAALTGVMARVFAALPTWSFYVFTSFPDFERVFGRPPSKRRKLYNGTNRCDLFQYHGPRPPRDGAGVEA